METACASMFDASRSYVKNICLSMHIKCLTGTQFIVGADKLMIWIRWERVRERERDAEQEDARNMIKKRCFRTLILKHVNPFKSLEDSIAIHIWIYFFRAPLVLMAWQQFFLFSKAVVLKFTPSTTSENIWLSKYHHYYQHSNAV